LNEKVLISVDVVLAVMHEAGLIGALSAMVAMAVVCTLPTAPAMRLCQRPAVRCEPSVVAARESS
jgi:hypothetical protein